MLPLSDCLLVIIIIIMARWGEGGGSNATSTTIKITRFNNESYMILYKCLNLNRLQLGLQLLVAE